MLERHTPYTEKGTRVRRAVETLCTHGRTALDAAPLDDVGQVYVDSPLAARRAIWRLDRSPCTMRMISSWRGVSTPLARWAAAMLARDAFMSRIQLGIRFRDAMVDAYRAGRLASDRGVAILRHRYDDDR